MTRIKTWWRGRYIPPYHDPTGALVVISPGHYERPIIARICIAVGKFWLAHWQWTIGTIIAVIALVVAL